MAVIARSALLALLCSAAGIATAAEQWVQTEATSAQLAYTDLDLIGSSTVLAPDGGLRIVTFWARADRASAEHPQLPYDAAADLKAVTRCVTDLGPDEKVVRDRCWQTQP